MKYPAKTQDQAPRAPLFDGTQACTGAPIELFFPSAGHQAVRAVQEAKALCAGCPFLEPCRSYAMTAQGSPGRYVAGVWGGTTEAERTRARRAIRRASRQAVAA